MNDPYGFMRGKSIAADNFTLVGILAATKIGRFNFHCLYLADGGNSIIFQCVQYFASLAMSWQL